MRGVPLLVVACTPTIPITDGGPDTTPRDATADTAPIGGDTSSDTTGTSTLTAGSLAGSEADEGFGSAVLFCEDSLIIGAPHRAMGRVYGGTTRLAEGDGRMGSALACVGGVPLWGAPLARGDAPGVADPSGTLLAGGDGVGHALVGGDGWLAATADGWVDAAGSGGTTSSRPTAVAQRGERIAVGMARGEVFLSLDGAELPRASPQDEAGFAVVAFEDGWAVGAPGENAVLLLDESGAETAHIAGDGGRFGAALAAADVDGDGREELLIGAPMAGGAAEGAAFLYGGGALIASWQGEATGEQLGFSVAITRGWVALGAPGGPGTPGRVQSLEIEDLEMQQLTEDAGL